MIAVNWNTQEGMVNMLRRQNMSQIWVEIESRVPGDITSWKTLSEVEQDVFKKALAGLTGLDAHQANDGTPLVILHTTDLRKRTIYSFVAIMEQMHAESHSHIFTALLPSSEANYLLDEWVLEEPHLEYKSDKIVANYYKLWGKEASIYGQYTVRVMSVFLETFLLFPGLYCPLHLAGQGKTTTSGEIIRKILLDESVHGVFTGLNAQHLRNKLSESEKQKVDQEIHKLLNDLYLNEKSYIKILHNGPGITEDTLDYAKYNGNKAFSNLGFGPYFEEREFNPTIEDALDTTTKNHGSFSVKGDGHILVLNVEALQDSDFVSDSK